MSKRVKGMLIDELRRQIGDCRELLVVDVSKLDAVSTNKFRLALREKDIQVLAVRNTLAKRAFGDVGVTGLDAVLQGPSALIWGGPDIVALSKEITKWAKDLEPLKIKGGTLEGSALNAAEVEQLSKSPSREELIGQIVGMALSPGANLAAALLGPGSTLASQLKTIVGDDDAAGADASA